MMEKLSQNSLESFYKKETKGIGKKKIEEKVHEIRNEKKNQQNKTIFLSHSHLDKTIVNKIALLFQKLDADLYVDWLDKTLPEVTNHKTAIAIKDKIQNSEHFLFLATYHGLRSKWCNWELGIADSIVDGRKLAILPIKTKTGNWSGNEYLNLYPEMKFEIDNLEDITVDKIQIFQIDGGHISLKNWLK